MTDPVARLVGDILAVGEEHGVTPREAATVLSLQMLARRAGCRTPEEGLAWTVERGYAVRTGRPDEFEITEAGRAAVREYLHT